MTPGTYIRLHREAAGYSLDDIALMTETDPAVCARSRAEWLATIEADTVPMTMGTALRLQQIIGFDWIIFGRICSVAVGIETYVPPLCRACARCEYDGDAPWAEADRCVACASRERLVA